MSQPIVFGAAYSVYVWTVRLTLAEKGTPYQLVEIDVFSERGPPPDYFVRHPFGRIPAFGHDDFQLYETDAIVRYIDETFDGPSLIPDTSRGRARMTQAMRILDCYAYPNMVWGGCTSNRSAHRRKAARQIPSSSTKRSGTRAPVWKHLNG